MFLPYCINTKHLTRGEITIYSDNEKVINGVLNEIDKESKCTQEASATIEAVKREIGKATIEDNVKYSNKKPRPGKTFQQEPRSFLVKECDERSKELRCKLAEEHEENAPHIGSTTPIHNGVIKDKAVSTVIREVDAQNQEEEHVKCKTPENWIHLEARNYSMKGSDLER